MRFNLYARNRIINLKRTQNLSFREVARRLKQEDNIDCHRQSVFKIWKRYQKTGLKTPGHAGGRTPILQVCHLDFIDQELLKNSELTAAELQQKLQEGFGLTISRQAVQKARRRLGWKYSGTRYCQLISEKNKKERLAFAIKCLQQKERFENVVFTDETKVQLESNTRRQCRKEGQPVSQRARPVPKHPYQLYGWAGISCRGATNLFCFGNGTMDSAYYQQILTEHYIPFVERAYPEGARLWQDNDPKHVSNSTKSFMEGAGIQWWPTPAQSPDLNPIEMVWHQAKHYLRKHVKPKTKDELVKGLQQFWKTVTPTLCQRYIRHLKKVLPLVVLRKGAASGY